ncbi:unnamed protein product [Penicillium pancosmium]
MTDQSSKIKSRRNPNADYLSPSEVYFPEVYLPKVCYLKVSPPQNEISRSFSPAEDLHTQLSPSPWNIQISDDEFQSKESSSGKTASSRSPENFELPSEFLECLSAEDQVQFLRARNEKQKRQMTLQSSSSSDVGILLEGFEEHEDDSYSHSLELEDSAGQNDFDDDDDDNLLFCKLAELAEEPLDPDIEKDQSMGQELELEDADTHHEAVLENVEEATVQKTASKSKKKSSKGVISKLSRKEQETAKGIGRRKILTDKKQKPGGVKFDARSTHTGRQSQTKTTRLSDHELRSIFVHSDIVRISEINSGLPAVPGFSSHVRKVALQEMVASIPTEQQAEARSDKQRINEAIRQFNHKPKSDQQGLWKVKGLKTSLFHHQVLAVGWMRDRERSTTPPYGGLLCDVMGLGKTVTALANILDGRREEDERRPPTLIVVPSQLVDHWMQQMKLYFDPGVFGTVYKWDKRSSSAFEFNLEGILAFDVVLATFENIRKSYPNPKVPSELQSDEDIDKWWSEFYDREQGVFHKIKWYRIVLDEGHIIKNRDSQISMAVRALCGYFKWILSGTPLHNCVEEMFPYFNLLGVPNSSHFEVFKRSYCDLRMFVSHILTAQDVVRYALKHDGDLMNNLKALTTSDSNDASTQIVESLIIMADAESVPKAPIGAQSQLLVSRPSLRGNYKTLSANFEKLLEQLREDGHWVERHRRLRCAHCEFPPQAGILTSCYHLYCEECFDSLSSTEAGSNKETLFCYSCTHIITETAYYNIFDRIDPDEAASPVSTTSKKRKRGKQTTQRHRTGGNGTKRAKKPSKSSKAFKPPHRIFHSSFHDDSEDEEHDPPEANDPNEDWIPIIGQKTPGAKLTNARELIRSFMQEDDKVKIVIFTIFIDTTTLMEQICEEEGWSYTKASYQTQT